MSLTNTLTHALVYSLTHSAFSQTHTHSSITLTHSLSLSLTHTNTNTYTALSLTHTHTYTHSLYHTLRISVKNVSRYDEKATAKYMMDTINEDSRANFE